MADDMKVDKSESREDLRRRLRAKMRNGRNHQEKPLPRQMRDDPLTTLLALGVDDVSILRNSSHIAKNPYAALQALTSTPVGETAQPMASVDTDDEEAPPPF